MAHERIDDWIQAAKDLARAERELQIDHWVYITIEYREDDPRKVVLHKIDIPRRMLDRWQWLVDWRKAKYVCQYPRKGVQVYYCYYDKRTGLPASAPCFRAWRRQRRRSPRPSAE